MIYTRTGLENARGALLGRISVLDMVNIPAVIERLQNRIIYALSVIIYVILGIL